MDDCRYFLLSRFQNKEMEMNGFIEEEEDKCCFENCTNSVCKFDNNPQPLMEGKCCDGYNADYVLRCTPSGRIRIFSTDLVKRTSGGFLVIQVVAEAGFC